MNRMICTIALHTILPKIEMFETALILIKLGNFIIGKGNISFMFGKAKCKLCGQNVRFALRHLKQKHPETLNDKDIVKLRMDNVMRKYFT